MRKQILSLMLAFLLILGFCVPTAQAAAMTWQGWTPVSTEEDLRAIENDLSGKYYLTNNIVLSSPWLPLGDMGNYSNTFKGTFDGNGFTISNLQASEEGSIGLFHYCSGKIRNLTLSVNAVIGADSSVSTGYIGGIASSLYSGGVISNCTVTGSMEVNIAEGVACVGGISGTNSGSIEDCTSSLNITAMDTYADGVGGNLYLGGITGVNNSTVKRCTNSGALRGHDRWNYIGGIVGRMNQDGTIEQCSNSGTVHGTCLLEEDYSEVYAGGIVGNALSDSNPIVRCYNTGNVTSEASYYIYAGGIAGFSGTDLTECYNTGTITGVNRQLYTTSDYAELTIGGIVGYLSFKTPNITHCYNTGKLVYKPYNDLYAYRHYTPFAGGIAGIAYDNTISDCYNMGTVTLGSRYTYWVGGIVGMDWGGPGSPCNYSDVYWYKSGYTAALYQNRSGTTADTTGAVTTLSSFASQDTFSGFTFGTAWSMGETNPLLIYTVPHTHNLAKYSGVNPTCTAAGRADYWMCRSCYVYFRDQGFNTVSYADLSIPKVDHSYTDWSTVLEPGCTSTGTEERGCENCTHTESRTIDPLGHAYDSVVTAPTCIKQGFTTYTCSICSNAYTDGETAALGHAYVDGICSVCTGKDPDYVDKSIVASGSCGDTTTWKLDSNGTLIISGTGEMTSAPWRNDYADVIKKVLIEEGVTNVYCSAFSSCTSLSDISLPSSLTKIGNSAFYNCGAVTKIILPNNLTTLEDDAFYNTGLTEINIPTSLTTWTGLSFNGCPIKDLYIEDLEHLLSMPNGGGLNYSNLYINGELVTDLVIPDSITNLYAGAFDYVTCLERVTIPESVTYLEGSTFQGCTNLKEVNWFGGITRLPAFTFRGCDSLTSLTLPARVATLNSEVFGNDYQPSALTELRFLGNAPLIAEDGFKGVTATVYYSAYNTSWTEDIFQNYGGTITWVADNTIPGTGEEENLYIVDEGTCGDTMTWTLDSKGTLTISGTGEMTSAPWLPEYVEVIRKAIIEEGVTSVNTNAFWACRTLSDVSLPSTLTKIGNNAFSGCNALTKVVLPDNLTTLGDDTFGDAGLTEVNIPTSLTTWTGLSFNGCPIKDLYIEDLDHLLSMPNDGGLNYKNLYINGELVTDLVIPDSITTLYMRAFDYVTCLERVTIPESVTSIEEGAFHGCENLKEINWLGGVTVLPTYTFWGCDSLTSLTLPAGVATLNSGVFGNDYQPSALTELRFLGNAPSFAEDAFAGVTATVYYSANNTSWTEDIFQNYGGTITWVADDTIPGTSEDVHKHAYSAVITSPTCTEDGYTTHICACGDSYVDAYTDAAGHTEVVDGAVPATCIQTGLTEGSHCTVCQEILNPQQELPLADHAWDEGAVTLEPTEDETGIKTYTCTVCSETREEAIPVLPHTHSHTAVITAPTCTEDGFTTHTCACGDSYTDTPTAALGHSFAGGKCSTCGAADPNYIPPAGNPFTDVKESEFYYTPVQWALENNITTGLTATQFGPMENCTRGQVVTFLWRAAGQPEPSSLINPFDDVKTSDFFYKAVLWAVEEGITAGYGSSNIFNPGGICNRGQVATFLHRYGGTPAPGSYHNPFTDVSSGAFYYDAVLWAVEQGITNGYGSDTIFNPDGNCTRGQIVTFLYRALSDN